MLAGKPNSKHDSADGVEDGKSVEYILYYHIWSDHTGNGLTFLLCPFYREISGGV